MSALSSALSLPRVLRVGSTGSVVTLLHTSLLGLGHSIPASELATSTFGLATRGVVVDFQKMTYGASSSDKVTGVVDQDTATALLEQLRVHEPHLDLPANYYLAGRITYDNGAAGAVLTAKVFDRMLRTEHPILTTTSDDAGYFYASYARQALLRPVKTPPSLVIRIYSQEELLYEPSLNQLLFNVPMLAISNIVLTQSSPSAISRDEFTSAVQMIAPYLAPSPEEPTPKSTSSPTTPISTPQWESSIADLREDTQAQDLSVLMQLTESELSSQQLVDLVLAHRLSELAQTKHNVTIDPAFFYSLLASSALQSFSLSDPANLGLANLHLATPIQPLLYRIARLDSKALASIVTSAAKAGRVPSSLLKQLPATIKRVGTLREVAQDVDTEPTNEDQLWTLIGQILSSGVEKAAEKALNGNNGMGDLIGILQNLAKAMATPSPTPSTASTGAVASLSNSTNASTTIASPRTAPKMASQPVSIDDLAAASSKTPRELAGLTESQLQQLIQSHMPQDHPSSHSAPEQASAISRALEARFPTRVFASKLENHLAMPKSKGRFGKTVDGTVVFDFLSAHPDFDLARNNIDLVIKRDAQTGTSEVSKPQARADDLSKPTQPAESGPSPAHADQKSYTEDVRRHLKTVQRLFKLAPTFDKTQALLDTGIQSASAIQKMGRERVVKVLTAHSAFSPTEAEELFHRATNVAVASRLIAGDFVTNSRALTLAGASGALPPAKLQEVTQDFPNMASLFKLGDVCACADCMTVYSPSAYLVDVYQFLKQRQLLDSVGGPNNGLMALTVFFQRRPDLADLDLSCNNTNTTLPHIDLVCELLEGLMAPDAGAAFVGFLNPGLIGRSGRLLPFLRDQQGLPFTDQAAVSDPDQSGNVVVRDSSVVVKLVAGLLPTLWTMYVLRQTYGNAESLAAAPAYVNSTAYARLAESVYLPNLPFNLADEEGSRYFAQFGVQRADLMRAMAKTPVVPTVDRAIARVDLNLSQTEGDLITTQAVDPEPYWNTGNTANPETILTNVQTFLDSAIIQYTDLQTLLAATSWVNPSAPGGTMFIRHLDKSCTLAQKQIAGLDKPALDRFHRILRLWKSLGSDTGAGWAISALDRALGMTTLSSGNLDPDFLVTVSQVRTLVQALSTSATVSVDNVLDLFGPLRTDDRSLPFSKTYAMIFLDATKNGPIDSAFLPANVSANEQNTTTTPDTLAKHVDFLSRSLGLSVVDTQALVDALIADQGTDVLSFVNISQIYAAFSLASLMGLLTIDRIILQKLIGVNPFKTPANMLTFTRMVGKIHAAGLSANNLSFILTHNSVDITSVALSDPAATLILDQVQAAFAAAHAKLAPPFDSDAELATNEAATLALLAKVPGITALDVAAFRNMMSGNIPAGAAALINTKLGSTASNLSSIQTALTDLTTSSSDPSLQMALVKAIYVTLTTFFYSQQRLTDISTIISATFGSSADITAVLFSHIASLSSLLDPALATGTTSPSTFKAQYSALQLINLLFFVITRLNLSAPTLSWLLQYSGALGWAALENLPTDESGTATSFGAWVDLLDGLSLIASSNYAAVTNPDDPSHPFSINGFFELTLKSGVSITDLAQYLASLTSWDLTMVTGLMNRLGLVVTDLRKPSTVTHLAEAVNILRRLNISVAAAIPLVDAVDLTDSGVQVLQQALKERYSPADWLDALKAIQDGMRVEKRDALVAFLLAVNKADPANHVVGLTSATDLSELLLIDVEVGAATLTSRIIQGHAAVQMFVQRLSLGLEPTPITPTADETVAWSQWSWMAQYRLWEANRQVFLYPENWIEPELRDNKSQIFQDFEQAIQQLQLTTDNIQQTTAAYLEALDQIADLEVMAAYYQTELGVEHVFARTKGGDPATFYYRQFQQEQLWTPWEKVDGVDVTGDHLIAFTRNSRLTIVWPQFTYDQDPSQSRQAPPVPDPTTLDQNHGQPASPLQLRLAIRIAMSERDPTTGKWSGKRVSKDAVFWPDATGAYVDASTIPGNIEDDIALHYWDFGSGLGQSITISLANQKRYPSSEVYVGAFALAGCKGYPEPYQPGDDDTDVFFSYRILPQFLNAEYFTQRYRKARALSTASASPLSIETILNPSDWSMILGNTFGRFIVTYPTQIATIEFALILLQLYALTQRSKVDRSIQSDAILRPINAFTISTGTFMPYFYADDSTRSYAVIPSFYPPENGAGGPRTVSDIYAFITRALVLLRKYLQLYYADPTRNLAALRALLNQDPDYLALKAEWLNIYYKHQPRVKIVNFYHPLLCLIRQTLYRDGFPAFFARVTQLATTTFDFKTQYAPTDVVHLDYPMEEVDFDQQDAYASYNWELFFHLPFEMASRLNQDQQFEAARDWYHYIFNPLGQDMDDPDTGPDHATAPQKKYWITKPFFKTQVSDYLAERIDQILYDVAQDPGGLSLADSLKLSIQTWRSNPYSPHAIARLRPVAYQITIVIGYIKNLLDWGDSLFRQLTREMITQATQLYMLADKLLGPKPQVVQPAVPVPPQTYNELTSKIDLFGDALVDLENLVPADVGTTPQPGGPLPPDFQLLYFGIPGNNSMYTYWDLVADRLSKIRNSQDIDGNFISLALLSPPIDPGALVRAVASGQSPGSLVAGLAAPLPNYRFWLVTEKASMLASQVTYLGTTLLSLLQQRDAEGLARLRSGLELNVLNAVTMVKQTAITEAGNNLDTLAAARAVIATRQTYYNNQKYMNDWEITAVSLSGASLLIELGVMLGNILAGGVKMIPDVSAGVAGFGGSPALTVTIGGGTIGGAMETLTSALSSAGRALDKGAAMAAQQGSFQRRQDEWRFQADLATHELTQMDKQTVAAKTRQQLTQADLAAHMTSVEAATQMDAYLRTKYTNQELYDWGIKTISSIYFTAYNLAYAMAKQAERCLVYELAADETTASFIMPSYFDSLHSGLLAGEQLSHDLRQMEVAYLDLNLREYELTKNVSLEQIDPFALVSLRATGSCTFTVPEAAFDMDGPGHYLRRNKSISLSVPCVVGPLVAVSAKLTMIANRYRARTTLLTATSGGDGYTETPAGADPRFVYSVGNSIQAIVTSSGVSDPGLFELSSPALGRDNSDRYLPFERTGALATYTLELPQLRQWDYNTISDVILHVSYTARDGGSALRTAVESQQAARLNAMVLDAEHKGLYTCHSLRRNFPNAWWALVQSSIDPPSVGPAGSPPTAPPLPTPSTQLTIDAFNLPYFATADNRTATITALTLFGRVKPTTTPPTGPLIIRLNGTVTVTLNQVTNPTAGGLPLWLYAGSPPDPHNAAGGVVLGKPFTLEIITAGVPGAISVDLLTDLILLVGYSI